MIVRSFVSFVVLSFVLSVALPAVAGEHRASPGASVARPVHSLARNQFTLAGNSWGMEMTNFGSYGQDLAGRFPASGGAGGEFPRGTGIYTIYAAGIQIGALVDGTPRVSVVDFDSEFQPGPLFKTTPGDSNEVPTAADPAGPLNKLFALYADGSDATPPGANGDAIDDFANWPSHLGAPARADGSPLVLGSLASWCVFNDLDTALHTVPDASNTLPLGLEIQQTTFQYNADSASNVFYVYYKIINKGTHYLKDAYIASWFDPDVDKSGNDQVATDSLASMVFTYNADNSDPRSAGGSAVGAHFFQGPVVPGEISDTARFLELAGNGFVQRAVPGKKNVGLATTVRFINVRGAEGDPDNDAELYNLMRGREKNGDLRANRFTYPEDPVAGIAARLDPRPDDKRMMLSTGQFDMAVGDTQTVLVAVIGAVGADRLDAVRNLRATGTRITTQQDTLFFFPAASISLTSIDQTSSTHALRVTLGEFAGVTAASIRFRPLPGTGDGEILAPLLDDGTGADSVASDGIWSGSVTATHRKAPYTGDLLFETATGAHTIDAIFSLVSFRPAPRLSDWRVIWEDGKQDRAINPGERVRLAFMIENADPVNAIDEISVSGPNNIVPAYLTPIPAGNEAADLSFYLIIDAPATGDSVTFPLTLAYDRYQAMVAATLPLTPWTPGSLWRDTLEVLPAHGTGSFLTAVVADPALLTGHTYAISFYRDTSDRSVYWRLRDSTAGTMKLASAPVSPPPGEPDPIVDGILFHFTTPVPDFAEFLVVANAAGPLDPPEAGSFAFNNSGFPHPTTDDRPGERQQVGPGFWGIHTGDNGSRAPYDAFTTRVTRDGSHWDDLIPYDFEIRFTTDSSMAWFAFTDESVHRVPFQLWNIGIGTPTDTTDDYQLVPYINDANENGIFDLDGIDHTISVGDNDPETDWVYFYRPEDTSPGTAGYDAAETEMVTNSYTGIRETEILARIVVVNWNGGSVSDPSFPANVSQPMPEPGTVFRILTTKANQPGDLLLINAPTNSAGADEALPGEFHLAQNYPNPFNPATTIDFTLKTRMHVKITVYNILGQAIRTLLNDLRDAGSNMVVWDGRDAAGKGVTSGVYFYRVQAGSSSAVKKMMLMK